MRPIKSRTSLEYSVVLVVLFIVGFAAGCSREQGPTEPDADDPTPVLTHKGGAEHGKPGNNSPPGGEPETFQVSVTTVNDGHTWTASPQELQSASKKGWLHVYDSGGNGTRGRPDYANAAFNSEIHMHPGPAAECESNPVDMSDSDKNLLYSKFHQTTPALRVFDFQVSFDITENEGAGFHYFLTRWQEGDGRVFSVQTGFGFNEFDPHQEIDFLGDNPPNDDDIRDSSIDRTFRLLAGAKVIASEHDGRNVIAALSCDNLGAYDVTVHAVP